MNATKRVKRVKRSINTPGKSQKLSRKSIKGKNKSEKERKSGLENLGNEYTKNYGSYA